MDRHSSSYKRRRRRKKKAVPQFLYVGGVALLSGALVLSITLIVLARNLPSPSQIAEHTVSESTKIYDRSGTVLLYDVHAGKKRTVVPLQEFPKTLLDATISIEDENFYEEPAFSIRGITRALVVNLLHGEVQQGGSTITQQLAKNAFLTPEQTITRKVRELLVALQLDRHYSKDEILEFYLNEIPYGSTLYGAEAASQAYFGKSANELTLRESAVLAALPRAPSYYSPWGSHVDELLSRANLILEKMYALGKISNDELGHAAEEDVVFQPQDPLGILAPHFVLMIQEYLVEKYGEDLVRNGGLRVRTTLDWDLQEVAERVVREGAERNEELYGGTNAALVAENPGTGEVLALVGSRDYFNTEREGNFNVATQGLRQPGSALKPFVYLTAFTKGYTPETVVFDVPTEFSTHPRCPASPNFLDADARCFHPENFDGIFRGPVSFRKALAESINVPAVKVLYLAGLNNAIRVMNDFGLVTLRDPDQYGLSLVLGGGAVRLADLVHAYATLSQDGVRRPQAFILEVRTRDGNVLESFQHTDGEVVIDPQYPRLINDILSDIEARSGLFQRSLSLTTFPGHDVALKTGTSNDYRDAWTVGYTPSLVAGVWAGNNDNSPMHQRGSSLLAAVPIWNAFMEEALQNQPLVAFTKPDPIATQKPILRGDYASFGEFHSILYFVSREDPRGAPPSQPSLDSQFEKWESAVRLWIERYAPASLTSLLQNQSPSGNSTQGVAPQVEISLPRTGELITKDQVSLVAQIESAIPIKEVVVFLNRASIHVVTENIATPYSLSLPVMLPKDGALQHLLEVRAEAVDGSFGEARVVVYQEP